MKQYIAPNSHYVELCTESLVAMSFNKEPGDEGELARKKDHSWSSENWEPAEGEE